MADTVLKNLSLGLDPIAVLPPGRMHKDISSVVGVRKCLFCGGCVVSIENIHIAEVHEDLAHAVFSKTD